MWNFKEKAPRLLSIPLLWHLVSNKDHWLKSATPETVLKAVGTANKPLASLEAERLSSGLQTGNVKEL